MQTVLQEVLLMETSRIEIPFNLDTAMTLGF